ncbi:MAG: hypothetical protein R3F62_25030 [Planctomycetota bacterium]
MATSPITCPNCGYKNYHPEATACEQCYAPLKPTAGPEETAAAAPAEALAAAQVKPGAKPAKRAAPQLPRGAGDEGTSPVDAVLYGLSLPLTFPLAIGASLNGQRQREVAPGPWLACGALTLCAWILAWYSQTGEGAPGWMLWPPVVLFALPLFGGMLLVRRSEPTSGLVAMAAGLTGLAVYLGLQVLEPTPQTLAGHNSSVTAIAVSRDGERLLSGGEDGDLRLWTLSDGRSQSLAKQASGVVSLAWPQSGPISVDFGGRVQTWSSLGQPSKTWEAGAGINCAVVSPNGGKLALGTLTGTVTTRKPADGENSETVVSGGAPIEALAFSPDSKSLAVGLLDGSVSVHGTSTEAFEAPGQVSVGALAFVNDGELVVGYSDGSVRLLNVKSGSETAALVGGSSAPVLDLAIHGKSLVSLHNDRSVVRWDLGTRKAVGRYTLPTRSGVGGSPSQVEVLPSGDLLVANGRAVSRIAPGSFKKP